MTIKPILPIILSTLVGCAFAQTPTTQITETHDLSNLPTSQPAPKPTMKKHQRKKGQAMVKQLAPNQELLHINLKANATTGYQWYVSRYNRDLLQLIGYQYQAPVSHLIGAGGEAQFTFRAKADFLLTPQITRITFVYTQPWHKKGGKRTVVKVFSPVQTNTPPPSMHSTDAMPATTAPMPEAASMASHAQPTTMTKPPAPQHAEAFPVPHHYSTNYYPQTPAMSSKNATHSTTVDTHMATTTPSMATTKKIPTTTQPMADLTPATPAKKATQPPANDWLSLPKQDVSK